MADQILPINEQATGLYTAVLVGNDGLTPIPAASLLTLTLTLYVTTTSGTDTLIRDHQNVLNTNNVTIDSSGNLAWSVQVADTTLVEDVPFEPHVALFEWTTASVSGNHEVVLLVRNLRQVP